MASIYSVDGNEISLGLQGSDVCDEAWQAAVAIAEERGEPVWLDDDDGEWIIYPDGSREPAVEEES